MNDKPPDNDVETRQKRREKKLKKKQERIPQHGRSLARVYIDAILKRLRGGGSEQGGIDGFFISSIPYVLKMQAQTTYQN